jgi:hypothetical protein
MRTIGGFFFDADRWFYLRENIRILLEFYFLMKNKLIVRVINVFFSKDY